MISDNLGTKKKLEMFLFIYFSIPWLNDDYN